MSRTLEVSRILPARPPQRIVLVEIDEGKKWVTWQQAMQAGGEWSSFWGHYFHYYDGGLRAARANYDARVRRLT